MNNSKIIREFLGDFEESTNINNGIISEESREHIMKFLNINIDELIFSILVREVPIIDSTNIPMFSSLNDCTERICLILDSLNNEGITVPDLGRYLRETNEGTELAFYKYGETHYKTAQMLGLVTSKKERPIKVYLTDLGYFYLDNIDYREELLIRLILRMKLFQKIIYESNYVKNYKVIDAFDFLSVKTINRRLSNVKVLIKKLNNYSKYDFVKFTSNLDISKAEVI